MELLSRNQGESIILELPSGETIVVEVLRHEGQRTIIGVDAPDDVEGAKRGMILR